MTCLACFGRFAGASETVVASYALPGPLHWRLSAVATQRPSGETARADHVTTGLLQAVERASAAASASAASTVDGLCPEQVTG